MGDQTIETMRIALLSPALRAAALDLLWYIPQQEKQELLPELLLLASFQNGCIQLVRAHIRVMSRAWLLTHIEVFSEEILATAVDDEPYRRLLELYQEIDVELMHRLARRAQGHPDEHVREVGNDFLSGGL
jgi:hypothetical protein